MPAARAFGHEMKAAKSEIVAPVFLFVFQWLVFFQSSNGLQNDHSLELKRYLDHQITHV